jgi:hypothetical protein
MRAPSNRIDPKVLARVAGVAPDAVIDTVVPRMRCMQCQQNGARWEVERLAAGGWPGTAVALIGVQRFGRLRWGHATATGRPAVP